MNTEITNREKRTAAAAAARTFAAGNPALITYFAAGILSVLLLSMAWTEGYFWQSWHLIEPALLLLVPAAFAALISLIVVLRRGIRPEGLSPETVKRLQTAGAFIRRRSLFAVPVCGSALLFLIIACWDTMINIRRSSLLLHLTATLLYGGTGLLILLVCLRYLVFRVRKRSAGLQEAAGRLPAERDGAEITDNVFTGRISFWILYVLVTMLQWFVLAGLGEEDALIVLFFLYKAAESALLIWFFSRLDRMLRTAGQLASGDLQTRFSGREIFPSLRALAAVLDRIRDAVGSAVEREMKSERLKTELITNVSHDLKTPLTSVINYTDLLKSERIDNENAVRYIEVLSRQSGKLRRLTEDLIEASKAATGNLDVHPEPCDLTVMLEQAEGEFGDRFRERDLTLITGSDNASFVMVMADGRHLWRVFDNLLSNICKYAMPGSRVYVDISGDPAGAPGLAAVTFRNISAEQLHVPVDMLMQRFVRGDAARSAGNPSGNGLGLSIADSLMKLMDGELRISIDGDLFKAEVILPKA